MENEFYYKKDRLNQLRGFIATVQNDCCAVKASKIIGLESATIGKQIKSLERDLGFKLFDILSNKKRIITPKGKLFYDEAVLKLQGIDGLFRNFSEKINEIDKNSIKIAGNGVVLSEIMPKYIEDICINQNYKSSKIMLLNIPKKEALEKVIKGEIDCAFYPSLKSEKIGIELKKIDIFEYNNVLIIHKNHPLSNKENLSREDVEKYPYLLFDKYEFCDPKHVSSKEIFAWRKEK